jgi:hypothetical protein
VGAIKFVIILFAIGFCSKVFCSIPKYTNEQNRMIKIIKKVVCQNSMEGIFIAMARQESNLNPVAIGTSKKEFGLFQIKLSTAYARKCVGIKSKEDLFNPYKNTRCAIKLWKYLSLKFNTTEEIIYAWNAGDGFAKDHKYIGSWFNRKGCNDKNVYHARCHVMRVMNLYYNDLFGSAISKRLSRNLFLL